MIKSEWHEVSRVKPIWANMAKDDPQWSWLTQFDFAELKPNQAEPTQPKGCVANVTKPTDLVEMGKVVSSDKLVVACYLERPAARRQLQLLEVRFLPSYPFAQSIHRNTFCWNEDF